MNGASPVRPLVNYPDDDADEDDMDILAADIPSSAQKMSTAAQTSEESTSPKAPAVESPPERISEKRRREDDEEDELLASISPSPGPKRRASTDSGGPKKISLSLPLKSGGESREGE
jgi:protein phosphatase-4 regulatory subunit 3